MLYYSGYCISTRPIPSGRPMYTTMFDCCKGAYSSQMSGEYHRSVLGGGHVNRSIKCSCGVSLFFISHHTRSDMINNTGKCISMLPSPPTTSPTSLDRDAGFWYPQYELPWSHAGCSNKLPLPYDNINDRPNYKTQEECCNIAYAGQVSNACIMGLPTSTIGSVDAAPFYYADYERGDWLHATCVNTLPLPFALGDRPTYTSKSECCRLEYAGQVSKACYCSSNPTPRGCPGFVEYTYATVTSSIAFDGLVVPSDAVEKAALVETLEELIASIIMADMEPGNTLQSVTIISIDGQPVRRSLRSLTRHLQRETIVFRIVIGTPCSEDCEEESDEEVAGASQVQVNEALSHSSIESSLQGSDNGILHGVSVNGVAIGCSIEVTNEETGATVGVNLSSCTATNSTVSCYFIFSLSCSRHLSQPLLPCTLAKPHIFSNKAANVISDTAAHVIPNSSSKHPND